MVSNLEILDMVVMDTDIEVMDTDMATDMEHKRKKVSSLNYLEEINPH